MQCLSEKHRTGSIRYFITFTFGSAYGIEFIVVKFLRRYSVPWSCQRKEDTIDYLGGNISYGIGDVAGNYSGFAEGRLKD